MNRALLGFAGMAAVVLIATSTPGQSAPVRDPGFYKASKSQVTQVLKALKKSYPGNSKYQSMPRRCASVSVAASSPKWFMVNVKMAVPEYKDCERWFGYAPLVKLLPRGRAVAIGTPVDWYWVCSEIAAKIQRAGGPLSVVEDVRAGFAQGNPGLCTDRLAV